jgi:hypothetical protein
MQEYDYLKSMQQYLSMALKGMIHGAVSVDGESGNAESGKNQPTIHSLFDAAKKLSAEQTEAYELQHK